MKIVRIFSRVFLGLTFVFSGFVKAVDPWGFAYKLQDYFEAFHMEWFNELALVLAVILCLAEFIIGVGLIFGTKMRFFSWAVALFMSYFLVLTFILALENPVSDCGCFGDAITLSNWETFYKNLFLMVFTVIVFLQRKKFSEPYKSAGQTLILGMGIILLLGVSVYSYRHLPIIDFRPWKIGNQIADQVIASPEISEVFLVYTDQNSGEEHIYTSETLPWQDSVLMASLEFKEQRKEIVQEYIEAPIHDFEINDGELNNLTGEVISNPDFQFLLIVSSIDKTNTSIYPKINEFAKAMEKDGLSFIALCGSSFVRMQEFKESVDAVYNWYNVDETALKTIIRSNPGLVLMKGGVIIDKWHFNDFPDAEDVREDYLKITK